MNWVMGEVRRYRVPDGRLLLVQSHAAGHALAELLCERRRFTDAEIADMTERVLSVLEYSRAVPAFKATCTVSLLVHLGCSSGGYLD